MYNSWQPCGRHGKTASSRMGRWRLNHTHRILQTRTAITHAHVALELPADLRRAPWLQATLHVAQLLSRLDSPRAESRASDATWHLSFSTIAPVLSRLRQWCRACSCGCGRNQCISMRTSVALSPRIALRFFCRHRVNIFGLTSGGLGITPLIWRRAASTFAKPSLQMKPNSSLGESLLPWSWAFMRGL